jgi:hypothetical protein
VLTATLPGTCKTPGVSPPAQVPTRAHLQHKRNRITQDPPPLSLRPCPGTPPTAPEHHFHGSLAVPRIANGSHEKWRNAQPEAPEAYVSHQKWRNAQPEAPEAYVSHQKWRNAQPEAPEAYVSHQRRRDVHRGAERYPVHSHVSDDPGPSTRCRKITCGSRLAEDG